MTIIAIKTVYYNLTGMRGAREFENKIFIVLYDNALIFEKNILKLVLLIWLSFGYVLVLHLSSTIFHW